MVVAVAAIASDTASCVGASAWRADSAWRDRGGRDLAAVARRYGLSWHRAMAWCSPRAPCSRSLRGAALPGAAGGRESMLMAP
ncbi:MAG: hypothetical protein ACRDY5_01765 [Acidimicrobiales bacterium]